MLSTTVLSQLLDELHLENSVTQESIPDLDLYMDQLITFFDMHLGNTRRRKDDKLLTKTMINNYTKNRILMPASKKKYSKEHIILLLLIYQLKQVTSMEDIQHLLFEFYDGVNPPSKADLTDYYQKFLDCEQSLTAFFKEDVYKTAEMANQKAAASESETTASSLLCLLLFKQSLNYKRLAEKLLDYSRQ